MEVHMSDLDGFKLKQIIDEEFAIPVIMISVDKSEETQEKALMSGVMRYIFKPIKAEDFIGIWQFAVVVMKGKMPTMTKVVGDIIEDHKELCCASFSKEDNRDEKNNDGKEHLSMNTVNEDEPTTSKNTKFVWTKDLRYRFEEAINILGPKNVIPTKIVQVMNVEGLKRRNVASHLQKYKHYLRQVERIFVAIIKKANEDNDISFTKKASIHWSLVFNHIRQYLEKTIKHSKRKSLRHLESDEIYISHLKSKLSILLSNLDKYSNNKLNANANDALSSSNLVQCNEPSQNLLCSPSEILRSGQASSSNVVGLLEPSSLGSIVGEIYSRDQTLPTSMEDINNVENIMGGNLFQPRQHHQIYNQGYHQTFATMDNNFASQGTFDGFHFKEIDDPFSMEDILNNFHMQHEEPVNSDSHANLNQSHDYVPLFDPLLNETSLEEDFATIESILDDLA
ncbi:hypothetical protein AAZX31_03G082700 [Glycine max]